MWSLDGRAVSDVIAAARWPESIPYRLNLDNPLEGAGLAAESLRAQLELPRPQHHPGS